MKCFKSFISAIIFLTLSTYIEASSYNSHGQTGLILLPSAEVHNEQSIYFTFNRSSYAKLGTITATPFKWMEASYFYYRPDDLLWGKTEGLYLDKGFNVKFSFDPKSLLLPKFAIGLDDFGGTGQFSREYIASTYNFNNIKFTTGIGWGKYVGDSSIDNPLRILNKDFQIRPSESKNTELGGNLSNASWFRGDAIFFGGIEFKLKRIKNLSAKIETNPFDYFSYGCCGEGISKNSLTLRKKESDFNFGLSYKIKEFGNIDFAYTQGNAWNITMSLGFSSRKQLVKKNKFNPDIKNSSYGQSYKNEFYLDLLENLNKNKLFLQTASLDKDKLTITIDSSEHINPIIYSSRSAYIAKEVSNFNNINLKKIEVGHLNRGTQINKISYRVSDLKLDSSYPNVVVKRNTEIVNPSKNEHMDHEFKPRVRFPAYFYNFSPDIRTHVGSPEKFIYVGYGIKTAGEIQLSRSNVINFTIGRSFEDNFDEKKSVPNSNLPFVRTQIVDYLQQSSKDFYLTNLDIESIWSPFNNAWAKFSLGYLEQMYGGIATEFLYKPFNSNFAASLEFNKVKKRQFDQKFDFLDYKVFTTHFNVAYYEPKTNILAKLSYGKYLAKDKGYTLDLSRKMPSGWKAGFYFTRTNVSAEEFGEGSFDKGFYFNIPVNIFSKNYSKESNGVELKSMTRDGGQKLLLKNKLIDSFYGSTYTDINENSKFLD